MAKVPVSAHYAQMKQLQILSRVLLLLAPASLWMMPVPVAAQEIPRDEYLERRSRLMRELDDGILVVHARTAEKSMAEWGFLQDPSFLYLSGLPTLRGAILALDGPGNEARLFIPPAAMSFGLELEITDVEASAESAAALGFASIEPWDRFLPWMRSRLQEGSARIYVDGSRRPEATGAPPGLRPVAGDFTLWREAVEEAFPDADIVSAKATLQTLRWAKSPAEVEILAANARATVLALEATLDALRSGMTQRETESVVVAACLRAGTQGPSFWPWTMSGPNAHNARLFQAFSRYDQMNRTMQAGELVRVDIGCANGLYGADVGRTLPVSGHFTGGQREAWNLLIAGYRAGLDAMRAKVPLDDIRRASVEEIRRLQPGLQTGQGKEAALVLLTRGIGVWHIHGVGIESGEEAVDPLAAGAVIAYEPTVEVGPDAFYLEDMILVTQSGYQILSSGLPYTANEIEDRMEGGRFDK
jgi:Xaa-Pro aminopeptidase